jgi:hypothetical protein
MLHDRYRSQTWKEQSERSATTGGICLSASRTVFSSTLAQFLLDLIYFLLSLAVYDQRYGLVEFKLRATI